jgi:hypothetical protein
LIEDAAVFAAGANFQVADHHRRERFSHHEDHEGHEDRITKGIEYEKHIFFLRALRVLRGKTLSSFGCGFVALGPSAVNRKTHESV